MTARNLTRLSRRLVTAVLVVAGTRSVLSVWLSSVALSLAGLWLLWRAWSRLERWLDARERALVPDAMVLRPIDRPAPEERHVAFARALGVVAAAYQSECEQKATTG